jgi:hypothetical protein
MARFGDLMRANFANPKPSYEYTRSMFVKTINEYVSGSLRSNLGMPCFGVTGMLEHPPAAPETYFVPPRSGPTCGVLISYTPGFATNKDYDKVAEKSRKELGSFWPNFFELIGKVMCRTIEIIQPSAGDSTPMMYNSKSMAKSGCFIRTTGNIYTQSKVIREWREAGSRFQNKVLSMKIQSPRILQNELSTAVRDTALRTMMFWRSYSGTMHGGIFKGFIYGSLIYE